MIIYFYLQKIIFKIMEECQTLFPILAWSPWTILNTFSRRPRDGAEAAAAGRGAGTITRWVSPSSRAPRHPATVPPPSPRPPTPPSPAQTAAITPPPQRPQCPVPPPPPRKLGWTGRCSVAQADIFSHIPAVVMGRVIMNIITMWTDWNERCSHFNNRQGMRRQSSDNSVLPSLIRN